MIDVSKVDSLDDRLRALNTPHPNPEHHYYAITLTADEAGKIFLDTQTWWVGWSDETCRHELREVRPVFYSFAKLWESLRQPYIFVHNADELTIFLLAGGNALVDKNLAQEVFGHVLRAEPAVRIGPAGFVAHDMLTKDALRRAPTARLRMQVLRRDDRRCRICGRRPDNDTDLELHVHHIRPWARGGITDLANLITLCHTCHNGLDPHEDSSLFGYLKPKTADPISDRLKDFLKGVVNYRKVGFLSGVEDDNTLQKGSQRGRKSLKKRKK